MLTGAAREGRRFHQAPRPSGDAAAASGDELVRNLYRAHAVGLVRLAVVLVGDQPTAEEVVQEAFLSF